jgi:hypothetical protein
MARSRIHRIWIDEIRRNEPAEVEFIPAPEGMKATVWPRHWFRNDGLKKGSNEI